MASTRAGDLAVPKSTIVPGPAQVIITVEGGVVQAVEGGPPGLAISVFDFDIDGISDEELVEDCLQNEYGECFSAQAWGQ